MIFFLFIVISVLIIIKARFVIIFLLCCFPKWNISRKNIKLKQYIKASYVYISSKFLLILSVPI